MGSKNTHLKPLYLRTLILNLRFYKKQERRPFRSGAPVHFFLANSPIGHRQNTCCRHRNHNGSGTPCGEKASR